jgi:hypothetical protein
LNKLVIILSLILPASLCGQDYIIDPNYIDLGDRYNRMVRFIYYESYDDTFMIVGVFDQGSQEALCVNKIDHTGADVPSWQPEVFEDGCPNGGISDNFFRVSNGYRYQHAMPRMNLVGAFETENAEALDFGGANGWGQFGIVPTGWADSLDRIYVAGLWELIQEDTVSYRNLFRFDPDGSIDESFPHIEGTNTFFDSPIVANQICPFDDERILFAGGFDLISGHYSPVLARLFLDGSVDTSFNSALMNTGLAYVLDVDFQGRILIYQLANSNQVQSDSLEIRRLLPDGSLDPSFNQIDLAVSESFSAGVVSAKAAVRRDDGSYVLAGYFNYVNGISRSSIVAIDSTGNVLDEFVDRPFYKDTLYFTQSDRDTVPGIETMIQTPDGGLLIGGEFTKFRGEEHINLIKLIPDSTTGLIETPQFRLELKVFPNPAAEEIRVRYRNPNRVQLYNPQVEIRDLLGRKVHSERLQGNELLIDLSDFQSGVYLVLLVDEGKVMGREKLVVR